MKKIGLLSCLVLVYSAVDINGFLLKHLTPRPGGIIDSLTKPIGPGGIIDSFTKPKVPGGLQLGSQLGGGMSFGIGSFGFNLGFNKQYVPGGVNVPPKDPHAPEEETGYPDGNPYIPKPVIPGTPVVKPPKPSITWEDEDEKIPIYPPSKEKPESYEKEYPKPGSYDTSSPKREDKRPDWEDIGEVNEKDPKSANFMDSDLVGDGLIQPRLNKKRNKRFIESKIYHVPLLFQSNAKPNRVKIHNSLNSLNKDIL